jgi:CTP synthase
MEEQKKIVNMGGTMRLGAWPCALEKGSKAHDAYGADDISERHRHRYEFNSDYRSKLEAGGMTIAGISPKSGLVEIVELEKHPWFVACQFHPEFRSTPLSAHPLFREFVAASKKRSDGADA